MGDNTITATDQSFGELISSGSLPEHLRGSPNESAIESSSLPEEGVDLEEYLNGIRRSLMRLVSGERLWNGNTERLSDFLDFRDPEHLIRWSWTSRC